MLIKANSPLMCKIYKEPAESCITISALQLIKTES